VIRVVVTYSNVALSGMNGSVSDRIRMKFI